MMRRSGRRMGTLLLAELLALPLAGVDAVATARVAGAAVTKYTDVNSSAPQSITAGPDGNLWFTNQGDNSISRITTAGAVTNFTGEEFAELLRRSGGASR